MENDNTLEDAVKAGDEVLESMKGRFPIVLVIGLNENGLPDIASSVPQYNTMHYLLNKGIFELNRHELNSIIQSQPKDISIEAVKED